MTRALFQPQFPLNLSRRRLLRTASAAAAASLAAPVFAQKVAPVKITVGYPPGGLVDSLARLLAYKLESELNRTVIVENKPGAGARLAANLFRRLPADGSNIMLVTDAVMVHAPLVFNKLGFDPFEDFTPITSVSGFTYVVATGSDPKVDSLEALGEWLRKNPNRASFGHPAAGSAAHFFGLLLGEKFGVPMTPVPYQGGAPLLAAVAGGGQVSCAVNALASDMLEFHRSGRTRIQAVTGESRSPSLPDVPTFIELGYPSVPPGWSALYLPKGASGETVEQLNQAMKSVLAQPDVRERIAEFGMQPLGGSAEALARMARDDFATWTPIIEKSGFKLEN